MPGALDSQLAGAIVEDVADLRALDWTHRARIADADGIIRRPVPRPPCSRSWRGSSASSSRAWSCASRDRCSHSWRVGRPSVIGRTDLLPAAARRSLRPPFTLIVPHDAPTGRGARMEGDNQDAVSALRGVGGRSDRRAAAVLQHPGRRRAESVGPRPHPISASNWLLWRGI
jgi:hypothetical protein